MKKQACIAAGFAVAVGGLAMASWAQVPPATRITSKTKVSAVKEALGERYIYGATALRAAAESQNTSALRRNLGDLYAPSFTGGLPGVRGRVSRDAWMNSVLRGGGLPGGATKGSVQDALAVAPFKDYEVTLDRVTTQDGGTRATAIATQSLTTGAAGGEATTRRVMVLSRDEWRKGPDGVWRLTRSDIVRRSGG